jgi:RNA polymerase sigma-70 factor (ECF subfamily)
MIAGTLRGGMRTESPERLVEQARAFSQDAWAQIYDDNYARIVDYCYLRTNDRAAAEDLASQVFLEALRGIRGYRYRGVPFSAWLYRIARNLTADFVGWRAKRGTLPLDESAQGQLAAPDVMDSALRWHDIHAALGRLTEDQQQVIILRFFQGLSHEETATIMRRRPGAVRVLQSRALDAMRRAMGGEREG